MNITNFMTWFIQQFINIGTTMLAKLDQLKIYNNISMMDFIITITIIGAFLSIVVTIPNLTLTKENIKQRDKYLANEEKRYDAYWESKR